jgi:hypothetical protein
MWMKTWLAKLSERMRLADERLPQHHRQPSRDELNRVEPVGGRRFGDPWVGYPATPYAMERHVKKDNE